MSEPVKTVLFKPLGWVLVATALLLLTWSTLAYHWPAFTVHGLLLTIFHDDADFNVYYTNLGWIDLGHRLFDGGYAEYPPFGLMYVNWPLFLTARFVPYTWWLWLTNSLLYVGVAWLTWQLGRLLGHTPRRTWWWWLLPSVTYYSLNRFDVLPVFLLALSLYLMLTNRLRSGWFTYGLSVMTKLYPLFLLPLVLSITRERGRPLRHYLPYLLAPVISLSWGMVEAGGPLAAVYPYLLQFIRPAEPGGWLALFVGVWPMVLVVLAVGAKLAQLVVPAWWLWLTVVKRVNLSLQTGFTLSALTLLLSIFFSTFYSSQWWVWLVPFLVLVLPPAAGLVVVVHDVLNYVQSPLMIELFNKASLPFNLVVGMRSAVMLVLISMVWRQLPHRWWQVA